MKKVISSILALVMVLAIVAAIPMTTSAAEVLNTSRYFAPDSTTKLDAFYGTPAIVNQMGTTWGAINGGTVTTLKDSAWDNALKVTFNDTTVSDYANNTVAEGSDYDVWILWDKDNLYILQDTRALYATTDDYTLEQMKTVGVDLGMWSATSTIQEEHSYYHILLPRDMTDLGDDAKEPKAYAVGAIPCLNDATVADYDIYECVSLGRDFDYASTTGTTNEKTRINHAALFEAGVRTFVERLDAGYRTSTVIPWSFLDSTADDAFAALDVAGKTGRTIGVWLFNKGAKHIYNGGMTVSGVSGNTNDTAGFDAVTLLTSIDDADTGDYYCDEITPDYDYWLSTEKDTNGQYIGQFYKVGKSGDTYTEGDYLYKRGSQTYEISTAAQLLALAQILEAGTNTSIVADALPGITSDNKADKALLTKGNVFKLTCDIDLNPGVTDWAKVNKFFVDKNNGVTVDISKVGSPLPANVFVGFDRFYGTLDGQGHTIKGLFNPDAMSVSWRSAGITNATGGIIGQLSQGGIKNLNVESGYVGTRQLKDNVMFGGIIGEIRPEKYTDFTSGKIFITNLNVGKNYTVHRYGVSTDTNNYAYAGVASSIWAGNATAIPSDVTINTEFSNIVFSGELLDNPTNVAKNWKTDLILGNNFKTVDGTWKANKVTFNITYKDLVANVSPAGTGVVTQCAYTSIAKVTEGQAVIPEGKEGYLVHLTDGTVVPHKVAEMMSDIKWQATVAENGRFNIRFVGETESLAWQKIGFEVELNNGTSRIVYNNYSNQVAYTSILAAGEKKTADDFGAMDGDYLYVYTLENLDATKTYSAKVKTYFTDTEGNLYVSAVERVFENITPWSGN